MLRAALIGIISLAAAGHAHAQILDDYPDAPAKSIIMERCGLCHTLRHARSSDFDAQGWHELLIQMRNIGAALTDDEVDLLAEYLSVNSPPKYRPPAVIVPGDIEIRMTGWNVPTEGSMPRDVAISPDGKLWISATFASILLEVDPQTGFVAEHDVRPYSAPTGIAVDTNGDVWFASGRRAYLGKFMRTTGQIEYVHTPDGMQLDPADLLIDTRGSVWFSAQAANTVGRLDAQSGVFDFVDMPRAEATPFSIVLAPDGNIFAGLRDSKSILRINSQTLATTEYPLADAESEPRRLAVTRDGIVWYTDIDRGYLGRLDPVTGAVTEYPSPSGPQSEPNGITTIDDVVWYVETNATPNTLVRFDTTREAFQTWPFSGFAVIRDLAVTEGGSIAFAMGSLNRVGVIDIEE
jgi:virginiamycin B lyase